MKRLPFHPSPGDVLVCDYTTGFRAPEMIKKRLCVVVSPKLKRRDSLATIVPLSQTQPLPDQPWHHRIILFSKGWGGEPRWAACDMLATVSYERLSRPHYRHPVTHARLFERLQVSQDDLVCIQRGIAAALGLSIEL